MELIYKIVPADLWLQAEETGAFAGAPIDQRDGFIHFSTRGQVRETAAKYFAGADDLLLIGVDPGKLGEDLRYEVSRGGALFPHLYAPLDLAAVVFARPLPLGADGAHCFDGLVP
ncbi:MAG TPA: DUF952 domain-containing protein [Methylovirgula sp.]|nr:DUF952 domain-containing protein [Methylovirgula sp.]